jgi:putative transposase
MRVFRTPVAPFAFCHRSEAHHFAVFPQCAEKTKVPIAVLAKVPTQTGAKGTGEGTHRRRCGDETTESQLGLSPDCPAVALAFGIEIDKDVVRRILSIHYHLDSNSQVRPGCFLGHAKDSLWSCDLFRCESATLRTHWVLVVMDQFTRRIIGFGVHSGIVYGEALCRMFRRAIRAMVLPKYLSSDHDPLYRFHQWEANLRVLGVTEIKTVSGVPISHPFVERLIGTFRREYLDKILFWTTVDLERKLIDFQRYYNHHRTHAGLGGRLPEPADTGSTSPIRFDSYTWQSHCRGLYQTAVAA